MNCDGCKHIQATYGHGWVQIPGREEHRAFVSCALFGRVYLSKHWPTDIDEDQPDAFFPNGCPRTQLLFPFDNF